MKSANSNTFLGSFSTWLVDRVNVSFRLRRYLRMIGERWIIMAVSLLLAVGGAFYLAMRAPNIYSASSKIGIAPKIQTAYTSQAQYLEELNNFYDSQLQYMSSSKVMAKVGEKMRDTPPPADQPFSLFTRAVKGPGSFSMIVECTDLDYARRYAQIWAREFITFKNELRENAIGKSAASTRDEVARYEKNLASARLALLEFQQKRNLGSVKETGDAAQQRLDKLEAEYQEIKTLRQRLESRTPEEIASGVQVDSLRNTPEKSLGANNQKAASETSDPLARFDGGSKYSDLKLQIKSRQAEWDRQSITLKPKHPFMVRLANDIQQLNQELQHQLDLIEEKRRARIKSLKADEESYRPLIEDLRQQVLASRNVQYQYERLKEEETNIKSVLDNLRKAEESLNSTTRDEGLFNIIEEGGGSSVPIRPNRRQMVLAGLVIGLGLGLGLIYLLGRLDDRMELAEDIEAELDEPVLGQLPLMDLEKNKETRPLVTNMDEHQMFYESMRGVRSAIIFGSQGPKKQVLLMTSAAPGDGKTTFSVNFALTLAVAGHRVLLVDADMRRGDTHGYFGRDREPGLAEVLQGQLHWSDVMKQGPVNTFNVIHTGKLPSNPGELLISPITREFIDEVRKSFDYVLFDCPPLTAIDDTFALVGSADGILFIVRSGQTSMRFAKTALAALRQRSAPLLGFVLNGIKPDNPYYYYKNYYHDYYAAKTPRVDDLNAVPAPAIQMAAPKQRPLVSAETQETLSTDEVERSISIDRYHPQPTNDGGPAEKGPLAA